MHTRPIAAFVLCLHLLLLSPVFPLRSAAAQTDDRCFAETGYCIAGRIREFWEQNDGMRVFGLPISSQQEMIIEGQMIQSQWFERNRLEWHPEQEPPYDVLLSRLGVDYAALAGFVFGAEQGADKAEPVRFADKNCRSFKETAIPICNDMLDAWQSSGLNLDTKPGRSESESLALFGLPLTPPYPLVLSDGTEYTVQWFERARFELHPELEQPYHVLFGLLGNEVQILSKTQYFMTRVISGVPAEAHVRNLRVDGDYARVDVFYLPYEEGSEAGAIVFLKRVDSDWTILSHGGKYLTADTLEDLGVPPGLWPDGA